MYSSELEKLGLIAGKIMVFTSLPSEAVSIYKITF